MNDRPDLRRSESSLVLGLDPAGIEAVEARVGAVEGAPVGGEACIGVRGVPECMGL